MLMSVLTVLSLCFWLCQHLLGLPVLASYLLDRQIDSNMTKLNICLLEYKQIEYFHSTSHCARLYVGDGARMVTIGSD